MTESRQAFTLVELMIVVAIIGLLSAIAVPNFMEMQLRTKRAEVAPNVQGIKISEIAYEATLDAYLPLAKAPSSVPGKAKVLWIGNPGFMELGWEPDGQVRGCYSVTTTGTDFVVVGEIDADGYGVNAQYTATRSSGAIQTTPELVY